MKLIAFTGYPGAGKSTAARTFVERFGYTRLRFAGPLKEMLLALPGITREHTDGALKEIDTPLLAGRSPRYAMEHLGTSWGRALMGGQFWLQQMDNALAESGDRVVIDDLRFVNEADFVRSRGGIVVLVFRPDIGVDWTLPANQEIVRIKPDCIVLNEGCDEKTFSDRVLQRIGDVDVRV